MHFSPLLQLLFLGLRVLDRQTVDVQVIADAHNHINDKAAVHTNGKTEDRKHESNLVNAVAKSTRPSETDACLQHRTESVDDAKEQRKRDDVLVRELGLGQVRSDHLAYGVSVHESDEEDEGNEVLVEDLWVEEEVGDDESPGSEERCKAEKGIVGSIAAVTASLEDVANALDGVERKDQAAVEHVEVAEVHGVSGLGQGRDVRHTESGEHGLLPIAAATLDGSDSVDDAESQDAFDGTGDQAQGEGVRVVLIPGLDVESQESCRDVSKALEERCVESHVQPNSTSTVFHP